MRQLVLGSLLAVLSVATSANAGERNWYAGIEAGAELTGQFTTDFGSAGGGLSDVGLAALATIGRKLSPQFSIEGELGYRSTDQEMSVLVDIDQVSLMINGIYEVPVMDMISLTLGAGVGIDHINAQAPASIFFLPVDNSDIQAAVQLKVGVAIEVGETTDLVANYRYMTTVENDFRSIDNSTLTVGLRFEL